MNKIYFPNLNGLRFIAAFMVVIHHMENIKFLLGVDHLGYGFVSILGELGVTFFFTLSGFLISYLLLVENENSGHISVRQFYIRRVLRIWPLYFLLITLGLFVFPELTFLFKATWYDQTFDNFGQKVLLFYLILPNLALALYPPIFYISHSWSIGVEEQFYLIWPLLFKFVKRKDYLMFGVIGTYLIVKLITFSLIHFELSGSSESVRIFYKFWNSFNIDCMAIGGLFAYYFFQSSRVIEKLLDRKIELIVIGILVILIGLTVRIPILHHEIYAILFGLLILNSSSSARTLIRLENQVFLYLGKISYGVYMWHPVALIVTIKFLALMGLNHIFLQYSSGLLLTILFAAISYEFYEKMFLMWKERFYAFASRK